MRELLGGFFAGARFELCTDLDLALGATGARAAIVLVAGRARRRLGRDEAGQSRDRRYGPKKSDEGSAFAIGKSAVSAVANATSEEAKNLRARISKMLGVDSLEKFTGLEGAEADEIYPRVFQ